MKYALVIQFFGRGRSKSGGGGSKGKSGGSSAAFDATEVKLLDGTTLDLSSYPLHYGDKDPTLTPAQRATTEAWEAKRVTAKIEYGTFVDENGRPRMERRGGKESVGMPTVGFQYETNLMSHIHPRDKGSGQLGGTFSEADVINFARLPARTTRAAAAEGTYSISKTSRFDKVGAMDYFTRINRQRDKEHKDFCFSLESDMWMGKISRSEYKRQRTDSFNRMLVNLHNDYAAGAETYGYVYTLEKRG